MIKPPEGYFEAKAAMPWLKVACQPKLTSKEPVLAWEREARFVVEEIQKHIQAFKTHNSHSVRSASLRLASLASATFDS